MIQLFDSNNNEYKFEITKFPDGTSQVWKINPEPPKMELMTVRWMFENEAELMHVCQLGDLLYRAFHVFPTLVTPYLPFARQDKKIANTLSFARNTFINLIVQSGYTRIKAFDAHSGSNYVESVEPKEQIELSLHHSQANIVCFPDKGALERYRKLVPKDIPVIFGNKRRNQLTGAIEGLELELNGNNLDNKSILVVDDICDGGRTFTELADKIKEKGTTSRLSLYISHGIFSKGQKLLLDAGYSSIYTTNSLLKNKLELEWTTGDEIIKILNILDTK